MRNRPPSGTRQRPQASPGRSANSHSQQWRAPTHDIAASVLLPTASTAARTTPAAVVALQRTHGNQFIQRVLAGTLIQRKGTIPLKAGKVTLARNWYAARKNKYTKAIIAEIQFQVGATPTGTMDSATIQAIAIYQNSNPPLAVDGIAGPRMLPALFASGLATAGSSDDYVAKAKSEVQAKWATLSTPEARASALGDEANKKLVAAGVPACNKVVGNFGAAAGQLDFPTWTLQLGKEPFNKATITDAEAAEIAETVYHEARHAEQWHMMARLLAGQKKSAAQIVAKMGIPAAIAADAFSKPLVPGSMEALIAQGWYDSVYGKGAVHRNQTLISVEAAAIAYRKTQEAFEKDPTPANQKKLDATLSKFQKLHAQYKDLPEEADAWRVGGQVSEKYTAP